MPTTPTAPVTDGGLLARTLAHWQEKGWTPESLGAFRMGPEDDPFDGLSDSDIEAIVSLSDDDVTALEALSDEQRASLSAAPAGSDLERRLARANREAAQRRHDLRPWKELAAELDMTPDQIREAIKGKKPAKKAADADGDDQIDPDEIRRQARREAQALADARAVKVAVKEAALDFFADATDAHRYLDLEKYEVDADGEIVDPDELLDDLKDILASKPHLAKVKERKTPKPDPGQGRRDAEKSGLDAGAERARRRFGTTKTDAA